MNNLTLQEQREIDEYINIFKRFNFRKHHEVNNYISENELWNRFPNIRSENTHENGAVVDLEAVMEAKLVKKALDGLKVLGRGELNVALTVKASKFSKSAVKAIEAAGGKTEVI